MKIQSIPIQTSDEAVTDGDTGIVMLEVSGPVDPSDAVLRRARQMVAGTGSPSMIESFDWALKSGAVLAYK